MQYLLSGIENHIDMGFGVTGDAYYRSAQHLVKNHFENFEATPQAEMPQNFLFRHSIELYIKSLIIIFHRKLKINYGSVLFKSEEPEIYTDGQWKKLYTCHFIDKLYSYWLNYLMLPNIAKLKKMAPKGDWQIYENITESFKIVCKYDQDSSYFRYPITKNSSLDHEKYTMQKSSTTDPEKLATEILGEKSQSGSITLLVVDENDNIVNAYKHTKEILFNVQDALKEIAEYFYCMHVMSRVTLSGGL